MGATFNQFVDMDEICYFGNIIHCDLDDSKIAVCVHYTNYF
jgi:hypothetical protein